ncbi:MAG: ATP-binding protein [Ignavibacteriaceae bacterium]
MGNEQKSFKPNQYPQEMVEETTSLLNATLNSIKEGILVVNLKGKIIFFNKKFLEIWNIPEEIICEKDDDKTIKYVLQQLKYPGIFIEKINELYSELSAESTDLLEFNDERYIERFSRPLVINNITTGRVWSFLDITDKIIIKESLDKEKELFQTLLDNIPDTIYFKDKDSKFIRVNKAQAKTLGIPDPKEAVGKSDIDFFEIGHATDAYEDEQKIMQSKIPLIAKVEKIRIAEGEYRWVTATKVPIINKGGQCTGLVGLSRDITPHKLAEEKLEKYSQELKAVNAAKDKLFSIIAHDLRSPFSSLLGLSEIVLDDFNTLTRDEIKRYNIEIYNVLKDELTLLENLLNWLRLETGQLKINREKISLYDITESVINLLSVSAKLKDITFLNETEKNIFISADPIMLHSVLQNLITNSIKFTNKGGLIKFHSVTAGNDLIQITVSDNGIGMTNDQVNNLFGLKAVSTRGTNNEKGTGLGLMICKEMIDLHGGTISVKSETGIGTDISFTLLIAEK